MTPILAIVLLCSAATPSQDCTRETALDVVVQPAPGELACLQVGQQLAAEAFAEALARGGVYPRIDCRPRRTARAAD